MFRGHRWEPVAGSAQSGEQGVVFDDQEEDLGHAAGVDDEEERRPGEDLVGAESCGCERLGGDGDGEDGGAEAPCLHGFPFDDADDDDGYVDEEDDDTVDPWDQRAA